MSSYEMIAMDRHSGPLPFPTDAEENRPDAVANAGSFGKRSVFLAAGLLFTGLGFLGAFLPVLPTTPFLILAAACYTRSSPRLESWLLHHERFGPLLRGWRLRGAIPRRAKFASLLGSVSGYAILVRHLARRRRRCFGCGADGVRSGLRLLPPLLTDGSRRLT